MLIAFGGLPATGKTTLARELSRRLSALYLRIDTLEQAILRSGIASDAGPAGYLAAYAIAVDNLALGSTIVVDSVNASAITRDAWLRIAEGADRTLIEIEVVCLDTEEHRRRAETRQPDIAAHRLPTWQEILDRSFEPWLRPHLVIDTANLSPGQAVEQLVQQISVLHPHPA